MSIFKVGLIGCGVISNTYLQNSLRFNNFDVVLCADQDNSRAVDTAKQYDIQATSIDELVNNDSIHLILNLTPPEAHKQINIMALRSGKHVYSEKPFALNLHDAEEIMNLAKSKGLHVGSAPDSFLGEAHQTAKKIIRDNIIGRITAGTASLMNFCGYTSDHPGLGFFFKKGGGPLFDMGPYYILSMVDLLGPVKRVAAMGKRTFDSRMCKRGLNKGKNYPVDVDTHFSCIIEFCNSTIVTYNTSFDVWGHHNPRIELFGTKGSIQLPEPSNFDGDIKLLKAPGCEWKTISTTNACENIPRGLGLSEMIDAICNNRQPKCSAKFASYVLEIMCALEASANSGTFINIEKAPPDNILE